MDESGFQASYEPIRGRSQKGKPCCGTVRGNAKKRRQNLIMATSKTKKVIAPLIFEASCYAERVEHWLKEVLIPEIGRGMVIIMDNAPFHRKNVLRSIAKSLGCMVLFLPPYSPDFNPIEKLFAHIKRWLRYDGYGKTLDDFFVR